jgi:hypothetical protein
MYPSEETQRNRWQDEYDASTREHAWQNETVEVSTTWHIHGIERAEWLLSLTEEDDDDDDIPNDIKQAFEEE